MTPCRESRGFTLLELLMAAAITVLLAALMLSVTTAALRTWHRAQDSSAMARQAKLALDLLQRDLQSGIRRHDGLGNTWLAADIIDHPAALASHGWLGTARMKPDAGASIRLVPAPGDGAPRIVDARFGLSGVWLRLLAATTDTTSDAGVPHAISYQLARRPVSGPVSAGNLAAVRYTLFRTSLGGAETFANGNNLTAAAYAALANPSTSADPLATNVVDFGVWLYLRDGSGALRRIFPTDNADLSHVAADAETEDDAHRYPDAADVMVRILTNEGVRLLDAMERPTGALARPATYSNDAAWWWGIVEANSRVFARRVEITGGGA
ncbi:MAG TPA: type II secretion system protein [Lacunisphaera sp.]|nr:type II secretion system protein [Lacunisphaera sp.]